MWSTSRPTAFSGPFRALVIAVIFAANPAETRAELDQSKHNLGETIYVRGRLLVQPQAGVSLRDLDGILQGYAARRAGAIPQINLHIVELPEQANEHAIAQVLARHPHIKSAELDRLVRPAFTPNDPGLA